MLSEAAIADACGAIGRTETTELMLDGESLHRFALAIGANRDVAAVQPVLGHWAWFLPAPADDEIGADGHPKRGGFLPALEALPRRMFASTYMRFEAPLLIDAVAQSTLTILDVRHKTGKSGDLVCVDVERQIEQCGKLRVAETQSLVYRGEGGGEPTPLPIPAADAGQAPDGGLVWTPGTVNLFRFSSVTFNGHRIHYDLPYATAVEGYPSLVVHGPFIAAKLAELARDQGPLATFSFRAQSPCFVDQPIRLARTDEAQFQALRCDGQIATVVKATYR